MRYLFMILSVLWVAAHALAHAARRRSHRVRRYASEPRPAGHSGVRLAVVRPPAAAPPLPVRPTPAAIEACVRERARRAEEERRAVAALVAISHQAEAVAA